MEFRFRNMDAALPELSLQLMTHGYEQEARNSQKTRELLHVTTELTHPLERELLVPGRKASLAAQIYETAWVLSGRNDLKMLSRYLPRAYDFSDDGVTWRGAYGPRLRGGWSGVDQVQHVVDLINNDLDTRRAVINIYDADRDAKDGKDIPCNNWISFIRRSGTLDMTVGVRSNDLIWGMSGINAFEWSVLLELVAGCTGSDVGSLRFCTTSLHVYDRHFAKAEHLAGFCKRSYGDSWEAPNGSLLHLGHSDLRQFDIALSAFLSLASSLVLNENSSYGDIKGVLESKALGPLLTGWLAVLIAHHTQVERWLEVGGVVPGTRLRMAWDLMKDESPAAVVEPSITEKDKVFLDHANGLHETKHAAYGDSWKRRGEKVGIQANVARKVDRLGATDELETAADTALDLLIYLVKYRQWLLNNDDSPVGVKGYLYDVARSLSTVEVTETTEELNSSLRDMFDKKLLGSEPLANKISTVASMAFMAYALAFRLYWEQADNAAAMQLNEEEGDDYRGADQD